MALLRRRPQPLTFFMYAAEGGGGLARVVITVANALAEHRPVRLLALNRLKDEPIFPLHPDIEHEWLIDRRKGAERSKREQRLLAEPTQMRPMPSETKFSALTDHVLQKRLRRYGPGILIHTRPSLYLAQHLWGDERTTAVGWDHGNYQTRMANVLQSSVMRTALPSLDAFVALTEADTEDYARDLGPRAPHLRVIRNPLSWPRAATPTSLDGRTIVSAGRLTDLKGFDRLIAAYAPIAHEFPDWRLKIYGRGPLHEQLRADARARGVEEFVELPGFSDDMKSDLRAASAYALTSRTEGFPMVLLEAMAEGLPLVSMDCPRGPGEIVDHGRNGLLTPDGDIEAFTGSLRRIMSEDAFREAAGAAAYADAQKYTLDAIVGDWLSLIEELESR